MPLIKVSIENMNGNTRILYEIDTNKSLFQNILDIGEQFNTPQEKGLYGLKLLTTNTGITKNYYISEDNFNEIKDGYSLKFTYSVNYYVNTIFNHLEDFTKENSYQYMLALALDPEFIKAIANSNKQYFLINHFTTQDLTHHEQSPCLLTIMHLLQRKCFTDISKEFLEKVMSIVKQESDCISAPIEQALSLLNKILYIREANFMPWKEEIIQHMPISELIPFIWSENDPHLQRAALSLINSLIKCCKGDKRNHLIKEINLKSNREKIYKFIILTHNNRNMDKNMAHELYVYQTYLMRLFAEALQTKVTIDNDLLKREEFEDCAYDDFNVMPMYMEFDESMVKSNKPPSIENLYEVHDTRISLASMSSKHSDDSFSSNRRSTNISESNDCDYSKISVITIEALRHYKRYHNKNFVHSQIEEKISGPGILGTSERIIRMLAKLLHVGREPDKVSVTYQPIIFNCSTRTPFFSELFSRTMWLLSKTRREMKASTLQDYDKVINILERAVRMILEQKPLDFKSLTDKMAMLTYQEIMDQWQAEKSKEMNVILAENESVQVVKQKYTEVNQEIVFEQRMNFVRTGTTFPKLDKMTNPKARRQSEIKYTEFFRASISNNNRQLVIVDYDKIGHKSIGKPTIYPIENITHIVEGRACPHVRNNLVKNPEIAFSVVIDNDNYINFKANTRLEASYWLDALNLLLDKDSRSNAFNKELQGLVEMDLLLHMMELQDVALPRKPEVPPPPLTMKPAVPEKRIPKKVYKLK